MSSERGKASRRRHWLNHKIDKLRSRVTMIAKMKARGFRCSFCGKSKGEVAAIMAGTPPATPGAPRQKMGKSAFICNECVRHYYQIMTGPEILNSSAVAPK